MGMVVNPHWYLAAAEGTLMDALFANGETGDYWRFDAANTDANVAADPITVATGLVNGLLLEDVDPANVPELATISGRDACRFSSGTTERLIHNFGGAVTQPGTIIVSLGDSDISTHVMITGSAAGSRWQISNSSGGDIIAFAGATLDSTIDEGYGTKVFTAQFNGASSLFRVNGTQTASGNAGTQSTDQLTIGALYDGTFVSNINVYSLLFINRILTAVERDGAERLLGSHAGLSW